MAKVANPRKQFQFSIQIPGLYPLLVQKVTLPSPELDVVEHGDGNRKIKTAGLLSYDNLVVEKLSTANGPDNWIWDWIRQIQNEYTGGGVTPGIYKKVVQVFQHGNDGISIINSWTYEGVWPHKVNGIELNRLQSDNIIESIEFCVDGQLHI
jgi:phage tail-like protein